MMTTLERLELNRLRVENVKLKDAIITLVELPPEKKTLSLPVVGTCNIDARKMVSGKLP